MTDSIALNVLYILTLSDVERGWILATHEQREQLHKLQQSGNKREYLEVAKTLPAYGCLKFTNATVAYPMQCNSIGTSDTIDTTTPANDTTSASTAQRIQRPASVYIGNKELCVRSFDGTKLQQEMRFKVTLMRCWRVTTNYTDGSSSHIINRTDSLTATPIQTSMELSFEYLIAKKKLQWVTISSEQAMLMSVCLQSMVEELLSRKDVGQQLVIAGCLDAGRPEQPPLLSFVRRDGHNRRMSESSSTDTISSLVRFG